MDERSEMQATTRVYPREHALAQQLRCQNRNEHPTPRSLRRAASGIEVVTIWVSPNEDIGEERS
jgi:hypothetical protein